MNSGADNLLSIGELAERANVSRRTVRYYVQRGLIDPPLGLGRASGYSQKHVDQIQRVLRFQREGLPLRTIEQLPENAEPAPAASVMPPPTVVLRVPLRDGVRLEIDAGSALPPQDVLNQLAAACERVLAQHDAASKSNRNFDDMNRSDKGAAEAAEGGDI